ncbi:MAG: hypothetical protein H0X30_17845 [Anaerolineae bacterium]|nr:hypothetical protein [Anaerolineae bacterium]
MGALRQNVKALLDGELEPIQRNGANQHTSGVRITKPSKDDAEYAIRRLKRDSPQLAGQG